MLEAFNPEVHHQLNRLACNSDRIKELVCWSYGANKLSCFDYESIVKYVKEMQDSLHILEALEKRFNDVV